VENRCASLEYGVDWGVREILVSGGWIWVGKAEGDLRWLEGATGERKTEGLTKEKIVVPVVQRGKVGKLPMWLRRETLIVCAVF
jgi:hypothetical protein